MWHCIAGGVDLNILKKCIAFIQWSSGPLHSHDERSMLLQNVVTTCPVMLCHMLKDQNWLHSCGNLKTDKIKAIKSWNGFKKTEQNMNH